MTLESQPISPTTAPPTNPYYTSPAPTTNTIAPPRMNATYVGNPNYVPNPNYNPQYQQQQYYGSQQQYYGSRPAQGNVPIIPSSSAGYGGNSSFAAGALQTNPTTGFAEYSSGGAASMIAYMLICMGIPFLLPFPFFCLGSIFIIIALNLKKSVIVFADNVGMIQVMRETIIFKTRSSTPIQQVSYTEVASVANTLVPGMIVNHQPVYDTVLQLRNGSNIPLSSAEMLVNAQATAQMIRNELNKRGASVV